MHSKFISLFALSTFIFSCNPQKQKLNTDYVNINPVIIIADTTAFDPLWSSENTLVSHLTSEPDNLHPANGGSSPRAEVLLLTQSYLLVTDFEKQSLAPGLVEALPHISDDGLEYTYRLRKEPKWDNGDPLSVEDLIFTAKAHKCPLTNNPSVKSYWGNLKDIIPDSIDDRKFTLVMRESNIQNQSFLVSFCILQKSFHDPKNILNNYSMSRMDDSSFHAETRNDLLEWATNFNDDKYGRDPAFLNGLGAYKVVNWSPGQSLTLIRKTKHWTQVLNDPRMNAYPEKIIFKVNKDENALQLDFKTQIIDVSTNLSMSAFISLADDPNINKNYHHVLSLTYNYTYLAFNERPEEAKRAKLFTDKNVRRAFALLTPVDNLTKLVYKDYSPYCKRMISNVSPLKPDFNTSLSPLQTNLQEAQKLLLSAGWKDSDADGILDKMIDGKKIALKTDLLYMNTSPDWKDMAALIAESFTKAGIQTELKPVDLRVFIESAKSHDFDLLLSSWGGTPLPEDFTQLWHTNSWSNHGSNYTGFGDAESDALIDSLKNTIDFQKRMPMVMRLQELIYDNQPYVFLFCSMRRNIIHKRFGNVSIFAERPGILLNNFKILSTTSE